MKNIVNIYWQVKTKEGSEVNIDTVGQLNRCLTEGKVAVPYYGLAGPGWMKLEEEIVEVTRVTVKKTTTEKKVFKFDKEKREKEMKEWKKAEELDRMIKENWK